ncbi:MAG: hypothetical protein HQ567_24890 [Candidatus Nealsonbacteria bacterium]|nr:hypothetical protein [Candidatus Nealsonbacteria bacterium]
MHATEPVPASGRIILPPVLNVDDYVFGYANVTYDTTIALISGYPKLER